VSGRVERAIGLMMIVLIVPEVVIVWAMRQWMVARRINKAFLHASAKDTPTKAKDGSAKDKERSTAAKDMPAEVEDGSGEAEDVSAKDKDVSAKTKGASIP
jgi:hypothetical protein